MSKEDDLKLKDQLMAEVMGGEGRRSEFFDVMRTYPHRNFTNDGIEFWIAQQVDSDNDKWLVSKLEIFNLNQPDGRFIFEPLKSTMTFMEALQALGGRELSGQTKSRDFEDQMQKDFPADQFPELKPYFHDVEYYKVVGNICGVAFDEVNRPYPLKEGRVFLPGKFTRSEIASAVEIAGDVRKSARHRRVVANGILGDMLADAPDNGMSIERRLTAEMAFHELNRFAAAVATVYMGVQKILGFEPSLDKVEDLLPKDKAYLLKAVEDLMPSGMSREDGCHNLKEYVFPSAREALAKAKKLGIKTDENEVFLAEMDLYLSYLDVALNTLGLEKKDEGEAASYSEAYMVSRIKHSLENAEEQLKRLGGHEEVKSMGRWVGQAVKLIEAQDKGILEKSQDSIIPSYISGYIARYFRVSNAVRESVRDRRMNAMSKLQTLPGRTHPNLAGHFNGTATATDVATSSEMSETPAVSAPPAGNEGPKVK